MRPKAYRQVLALLSARVPKPAKPDAVAQDHRTVGHSHNPAGAGPECGLIRALTKLNVFFRLHKDTLRQWDILEQRLSQPGQAYIALKDRATIADLSYLPFSMPYMFALFSVRIEDWPHVHKWSQDMLSRPAVKAVLERASTLGHGAVA